jgi:hypothetical protein
MKARCRFGDIHINNIIRNWLEFSADRSLKIVGPGTKDLPSFLLHLAPQIELKDLTATEYLDESAGIKRGSHDGIEKRLSAYIRHNGKEAQMELNEFMNQQTERLIDAFVEKVKSLPIRDGDIDIQSMGGTPGELARTWLTKSGRAKDDLLEAFLKSKGA